MFHLKLLFDILLLYIQCQIIFVDSQ